VNALLAGAAGEADDRIQQRGDTPPSLLLLILLLLAMMAVGRGRDKSMLSSGSWMQWLVVH